MNSPKTSIPNDKLLETLLTNSYLLDTRIIEKKYEVVNTENERDIYKKQLTELNKEMSQTKEKILEYEKSLDEIAEIKKQLEALQNQTSNHNKKIATNINSDMKTFAKNLIDTEKEHDYRLKRLLDSQKGEIGDLRDNHKKKLQGKDEVLNELNRQLAFAMKQIDENEHIYDSLLAERARRTHLQDFTENDYLTEGPAGLKAKDQMNKIINLQALKDRAEERIRLLNREIDSFGDIEVMKLQEELSNTTRLRNDADRLAKENKLLEDQQYRKKSMIQSMKNQNELLRSRGIGLPDTVKQESLIDSLRADLISNKKEFERNAKYYEEAVRSTTEVTKTLFECDYISFIFMLVWGFLIDF